MKNTVFLLMLFMICSSTVYSQIGGEFIVIDQFGYLPGAPKVAVIRDPHIGFDETKSFEPGPIYAVVEVSTRNKVFTGAPESWKEGQVHARSGDRIWHFDFSEVTSPGTYYILDEHNARRSFTFVIAHNVYNEVLKQAMRTFFYQRAGFAKKVPFTDPGWADGASHVGPLQDTECRSFFDQENPDSEIDVSGGWYDAGDYNKYTNWTSNYVVSLLNAYEENPMAFGDDYNIPESGNGTPDIIDETRWGLEHLLKLQQEHGAMLSIVGLSGGSPPSSATGPSFYGPPNTSATLNACAAFARSAKVFDDLGDQDFADTLKLRALKAWEWAMMNPDSLFRNNTSDYNSRGLGAGQQETDDYGRFMAKLESAVFLFALTGDTQYRDFVDSNYDQVHLMQWNFAYVFEIENQKALLHYMNIPGATASVKNDIMTTYKNAILSGSENMPANRSIRDPYFAYMKDYVWGSNRGKAAQGSMYLDMFAYNIEVDDPDELTDAAIHYINYLHGVNPLSFVYLSNMYLYGAENGVNEFYHSWFTNGSPLWDRVGTSTYGPAPGFLTGGPNPDYNWDGCCPSGCGSASNNDRCYSESISPPKDQPALKSYKDFNTSWPLNSWSVTENSCGYQVQYIRLLSKYVTAGMDCNGEVGGTAFIDSCGNCAGGSTGITPVIDPGICPGEVDCAGVKGGIAVIDSCGVCSGGTTSRTPIFQLEECYDCNDEFNGTAFIDSCGNCAGGSTALTPILDPESCNNQVEPVQAENNDIRCYPNPSMGTIQFSSSGDFPIKVRIYDIKGSLKMETMVDPEEVLNLEGMDRGFYEIIITTNERVWHEKLILH